MSAKRPERVLGPYAHRIKGAVVGWRVLVIDAEGCRSWSELLATEQIAQHYADAVTAAFATEAHTTTSALVEYTAHLAEKGDKPESIETTRRVIEAMFPDEITLRSLDGKRCAALYEDLRTRPSKRTGKPLAPDSHRNALAQNRSFLKWCVKRGWIAANPFADVEGIGKRRPRGKSLGKSGAELRIQGARAWYFKALELATGGDQGATAALVALLLGLRASEIVSRKVGDLDEDGAAADLLWIPCSKTAAGRRTIEVPPELRSLLAALAAGKPPGCYLFEGTAHQARGRNFIIKNVHRVCDLAQVPRVTAHAMRGLLATITAERGMAGHLIAATLGHEDARTTMTAYAAPGSAAAGARLRGWDVLNGGVQSPAKVAK